MIRGTTPTITLEVDTDLSEWTVYVTMKGAGGAVELTNPRLEFADEGEAHLIMLALTQQETLRLRPGACEVQIRAVKDDVAVATNIAKLDVGRILKEGVIHG